MSALGCKAGIAAGAAGDATDLMFRAPMSDEDEPGRHQGNRKRARGAHTWTQTKNASRAASSYAPGVDGPRPKAPAVRRADWVWRMYLLALGAPALYGLLRGMREAEVFTTDVPTLVRLWGGALAVAVALGLRTSLRGGGVVLPAESIYALLAPIPRANVVRPALRRACGPALIVGAVAGVFVGFAVITTTTVDLRLWILLNVVLSVAGGIMFVFAGALPAALSRSRAGAQVALVTALAWPLLDWLLGVTTFPGTLLASVLHAPDRGAAISLIGLAASAAGFAYAWRRAPSIDLETAARRATRSKSIRLALSLGDPAAAILIRQDLAGEQPRAAPWLRLRGSSPTLLGAFGQRHLRSVLRWPWGRLARTFVLSVAAAASLYFAAGGAAPLLPVAAVLLWLAMLEFGEPLLQQIAIERRNDAPGSHAQLLRGLLRPLVVALVAPTLVAVALPLLLAPEAALLWLLPVVLAGGLAAVIATLLPSPIDFLDLFSTKPPGLYTTAVIVRSAGPVVPVLVALAPLTTWVLPAGQVNTSSGPLVWTSVTVAADGPLHVFVLICAGLVVLSLALTMSWLTLHAQRANPTPRDP